MLLYIYNSGIFFLFCMYIILMRKKVYKYIMIYNISMLLVYYFIIYNEITNYDNRIFDEITNILCNYITYVYNDRFESLDIESISFIPDVDDYININDIQYNDILLNIKDYIYKNKHNINNANIVCRINYVSFWGLDISHQAIMFIINKILRGEKL